MFRDWFREKYDYWREGKYGREASQSAFARYLGINQKSVNEYLNGKSVPEHETVIEKLRSIYGDQFLIALGRQPSTKDRLIYAITQMTPDERLKLLKDISRQHPEYNLDELDDGTSNSAPESG